MVQRQQTLEVTVLSEEFGGCPNLPPDDFDAELMDRLIAGDITDEQALDIIRKRLGITKQIERR